MTLRSRFDFVAAPQSGPHSENHLSDRRVSDETKMSLGYEVDVNEVIWVQSGVSVKEGECEERSKILTWQKRYHFAVEI